MKPDKHRSVRMVDLAAELGLSHATVSRALAGNRRISRATRERVAEAAERMGYRPDARMGELMARVRAGRREGYQGNFAAVVLAGRQNTYGQHSAVRRFLKGIRERSDAAGYGVSQFYPEEEGLDGKVLGRILRARGIEGVILLAPGRRGLPGDLEWDDFAWVTVGFRMSAPPLHAVTPDWFADGQSAVEVLAERGCRRIGYVHASDSDPLLGDSWLGGYLSGMFERRLAPMVFRASDHRLDGLVEWVDGRRPDALVVHSAYPGELMAGRADRPWIFTLNLNRRASAQAGLVTSCEEVGMTAVDVLTGQLRRGERGVPPFQKTLRVRSGRE